MLVLVDVRVDQVGKGPFRDQVRSRMAMLPLTTQHSGGRLRGVRPPTAALF